MSAEVFGLTQQILMLISAYINTGVCGKLRLWETMHFFSKTALTWLFIENQAKQDLTVLDYVICPKDKPVAAVVHHVLKVKKLQKEVK